MTPRRFALMALILVLGGVCLPEQPLDAAKIVERPRRFNFDFDPNTPLKDLLPTPPKSLPAPPGLGEDLTLVPELMFGEPLTKDHKDTEKEIAHAIAKINHLSKKNPDGFMESLLAHRADLRGLPFRMGKDCRTEPAQAQLHSEIALEIRADLRTILARGCSDPTSAGHFWKVQAGWRDARPGKYRAEASEADILRARVAALMQMMGAKSERYRTGLARHLATIPTDDAGLALARLALYAPEETVRSAAVDALKQRPANEYVNALLDGFRYPLPAVSQRAADALIKLQCKNVLARLVDVLDQPDPRAPVRQVIQGNEVSTVRELVRVNHHRNCVLCHAPANVRGVPLDVLTVAVPVPDEALPAEGYYSRSSPDIFVRTDVTYLRQDFSMMMKVEDAKPWPEMQRFDFFVRMRVLTAEEAASFARTLASRPVLQHTAAQYALRELTGRSPEVATAEAWRKMLGLPR
jgi:hypothetical protein